MNEENTTASNAVWAIAMVIIVAIIAGTIYYSGILRTSGKRRLILTLLSLAARRGRLG